MFVLKFQDVLTVCDVTDQLTGSFNENTKEVEFVS